MVCFENCKIAWNVFAVYFLSFPFKRATALLGNGEAASVRREMNNQELHSHWWKEDNEDDNNARGDDDGNDNDNVNNN